MVKTKEPSFHFMSKSRLIFLGIISLCFTPFVPMLFISAIPLIIAHLSFGRKWGYSMQAICLGIMAVFCFLVITQGEVLFLSYSFISLVSVFISEFLLRGFKVKKILFLGSLFFSCIGVSSYMFAKHQGFSLTNEFEKLEKQELSKVVKDQKQKQEWKKEFASIKQRASIVDKHSVAILIGLIFINMWFVLYFILNSHEFFAPFSHLELSAKSLLNLELPIGFIWALIACLSVYLGSDFLGLSSLHLDGVLSVLIFLGSVFFTQGISVLICFLNKYEIFGFFRTFLLVLSIFMFSYIISALGIFEFWGNFRNKLNKKLNKV